MPPMYLQSSRDSESKAIITIINLASKFNLARSKKNRKVKRSQRQRGEREKLFRTTALLRARHSITHSSPNTFGELALPHYSRAVSFQCESRGVHPANEKKPINMPKYCILILLQFYATTERAPTTQWKILSNWISNRLFTLVSCVLFSMKLIFYLFDTQPSRQWQRHRQHTTVHRT